jgi:hypothetical protein
MSLIYENFINNLNQSNNEKVIVDMDGVMADVYHQLVQFEKRDTGRELKSEKRTEA